MTTSGFNATRPADHVKLDTGRDSIDANTWTCGITPFTDAILPPSTFTQQQARAVLDLLEKEKVYEEERWVALPSGSYGRGSKLEAVYYKPLVKILTAIGCNSIVTTFKEGLGVGNTVGGLWCSNQSSPKAPMSMQARRPDTVAAPKSRAGIGYLLSRAEKLRHSDGSDDESDSKVMGNDSEVEVEEENDLSEPLASVTVDNVQAGEKRKARKSTPGPSPAPEPASNVADPSIHLAWCHTILVMEVKCTRGLDYNTILQLATYLRMILKEQPDRMFVFGFLLLHDELSVWYCDRSGLLGTHDFINIHEQPVEFIQLMVHFMTMSPSELGWDKTMKLVLPHSQQAFPSWHPDLKFEDIPKTRQGTHWELLIKNKWYRTIQTLSDVARTKMMCGRATIVWLAVCISDVKKDTRPEDVPRVVIKHAWTPYTPGAEFDLEFKVYEQAEWGDLLVDHEELAHCRTDEGFRKNCPRTPISDRKEIWWGQFSVTQKFIERQLCRLVVSRYGLPIKYCKNYFELIDTLEGVLDALEDLDKKGICHRDVSAGNILINPAGGKGHLIDLDHAKVDEAFQFQTIGEVAGLPKMADIIDESRYIFGRYFGKLVKERPLPFLDDCTATLAIVAAKHQMERLGTTEDSVNLSTTAGLRLYNTAKLMKESNPDTPFTFEDLTRHVMGVSDVAKLHVPPTFRQAPRHAFATGTPAFMSHEIINNVDSPIVHTAIHDVESTFWCAIFLAMTRRGPGEERRDDSDPLAADTKDEAARERHRCLRENIYSMFEQPMAHIGDVKYFILQNPEAFEKGILDLMSPYFDPLKPLLRDWYYILRDAFGRNHYFSREYPIPAFRKSLHELRQKLEQNPPTVDEMYLMMAQAEEERRVLEESTIVNRIAALQRSLFPASVGEQDTGAAATQGAPPPVGSEPLVDGCAANGRDVEEEEQEEDDPYCTASLRGEHTLCDPGVGRSTIELPQPVRRGAKARKLLTDG